MIGPNRGKNAGSYCSRVCSHFRSGLTMPCPACGKPVYRRPDQIIRGVHVYCTALCFSTWRKRQIDRQCATCGKTFQVQRHRPAAGRGIYCSKPCYRLAKSSSLEELVARALTLRGYSFERHTQFGPYFVDFCFPERKLIVEVDGDYWHSLPKQVSKAIRRDAYLRACGFGVYHLTEHAIKHDALAFQMALPAL